MPRQPSSTPTEVELAILRVLWDHGPSTVRQIHDHLSPTRDTGYSTTLKMIQVMTDKSLLIKDDSQRPQIYTTTHPEADTQIQLLDDLILRGFAGSAMKLVLRALSTKRITPKERAEIQKLLDHAKGKK